MRKFRIFDSENSYEYDVHMSETEKGTKYELFRSQNGIWTSPGESILSVVDHGNGIKFSEKIGKNLEYDFMIEVRLLLSVMAQVDGEAGTQGKYIISEAKDDVVV